MINKKAVRFVTGAVIFCMLLSVAPVFAFAEDPGVGGASPEIVPTVATWTFNADTTYQDLDNPPAPCYYYDGNPHAPTVEVTYTDVEGATHILKQKSGPDDMDYDYSVEYTNMSISPTFEITRDECTGDYPQWQNPWLCYTAHISMRSDTDYELPDEWRVYFYVYKRTFNIKFHANYEGAEPDSEYYGTIHWKEIPAESKIPVFTRDGHTFDGWYQDSECTKPFDVTAPFTYNDTNVFGEKDVYAKWVKDEDSGDDPTPGGDDPVPGGDGTDDTEDGGKPVPNTGVENMIPLFMWLLTASGLIIFSIKKKRA